MTDAEIDEMEDRAGADRWASDFEPDYRKQQFLDEDAPVLIAALREARKVLAEVEWRGINWPDHDDPRPACPSCNGYKSTDDIQLDLDHAKRTYPNETTSVGHTADCRLAKALGR